MEKIKNLIETAWEDRSLLAEKEIIIAIRETVNRCDRGELRCATPGDTGWQIHEWIKKAILLYSETQKMKPTETGIFDFHDKIPLKSAFADKGIRVVPNAVIRHGSFISEGVTVMPSYVDMGVYIDQGSFIGAGAVVGSCAQIGKNVKISQKTGIGGGLDLPDTAPVLIEDEVFIGSGTTVTAGVQIGKEAILGAGIVLTPSTPVIDVTGTIPEESRAFIPGQAVAVAGSHPKEFPGGTHLIPSVFIIGKRIPGENPEKSLQETIKEFEIPV